MVEHEKYLAEVKEKWEEEEKRKDAFKKILIRMAISKKLKARSLKGFTNRIRGEVDTESSDEMRTDSDDIDEN